MVYVCGIVESQIVDSIYSFLKIKLRSNNSWIFHRGEMRKSGSFFLTKIIKNHYFYVSLGQCEVFIPIICLYESLIEKTRKALSLMRLITKQDCHFCLQTIMYNSWKMNLGLCYKYEYFCLTLFKPYLQFCCNTRIWSGHFWKQRL